MFGIQFPKVQTKCIGLLKARNKRKRKLSFAFFLWALWTIWWSNLSFYQDPTKWPDHKCQSSSLFQKSSEIKTILLWNGHTRSEMVVFGNGTEAFAQQGCQFTRCEIVTDREKRPFSTYDAVLINFNDEYLWEYERQLPEFHKIKRCSNQRVVMFTQESPPALTPYYNMSQFNHVFNWTMTYRKDSDIPLLYGRVLPSESAPRTSDEIMQYREKTHSNLNWLSTSKKTKLIAWMVSHCETHGKREQYVLQLLKFVDLDIYGECGSLSCTTNTLYHSDPQCYKMIESTYKFYLSFENSICKDYVTEKLFKVIEHDIVPIVFGGADYDSYLPPHSYIDALDYTPKELADYLKLLDSNDSLYNEYFWWKDHFRVESSLEDMARHGFCKLCEKLHLDIEYQTYGEMSSWWDVKSQCTSLDSKLLSISIS